ncbi:hypothetical protein Tco_0471491 [Tanacetum coccineum]
MFVHGNEALEILSSLPQLGPTRGTSWFANLTAKDLFWGGGGGNFHGFFWPPPSIKMPPSLSKNCDSMHARKTSSNVSDAQTPSKFVKSLTFGASTLWARSRLHEWEQDCPDCEDSQFCHSSRVSHPQLHLGIRYPNLID